jgi:hypothetical protein
MEKICPKCEYTNIEVDSMGDCTRCGVHKTYFCSKCTTYFDKPKIVPSTVSNQGVKLYRK